MTLIKNLLLVVTLLSLNIAEAAPDWFGATSPSRRYENDPGANYQFVFGNYKTYSEYQELDFNEGTLLLDPLTEDKYSRFEVAVVVNKDSSQQGGRGQTVRVYKRGDGLVYYWKVSTGRPGHSTPSGQYYPQGFSSRHWSKIYNAPMLWSVFFNGGIALHSSITSSDIKLLGQVLSHGCVHIEDNRAEELFHFIGHNQDATVIIVQ